MRILICLSLAVLIVTACQPVTPDSPTEIPTATEIPIIIDAVTTVPTANPLPSRTPTVPPTDTLTPSQTLTPSNTPSPTSTPTSTVPPTATLTLTLPPTLPPINSPTPGADTDANGTALPTWTPPPADPSVQIADHYHFQRPISADGINYLDRTYPYGGTQGNTRQVHHGVDLVNPSGTPILAAGDGVVFYAGSDAETTFGPTTNYYGNLVVIQHNFNSPEGKPVFTLYGHMQSTNVQSGQAVKTGQVIGFVGSTGVAIGPHLHFEVRLGDPHDFNSTRNPDLWIIPFPRWGTLAGRVTDASGNLLYQATVQVQAIGSKNVHYAFTYPDKTVTEDDTFHENFTLGDLAATYYQVSVNDGQRVRFQKTIYVYPNRTTWINIVLN